MLENDVFGQVDIVQNKTPAQANNIQPTRLQVSKNPTIITQQILPRGQDPNIFITPEVEEDLPDIPSPGPAAQASPQGRRGRGRPRGSGRGRGVRGAPKAAASATETRPKRARNYAPVVETVRSQPSTAATSAASSAATATAASSAASSAPASGQTQLVDNDPESPDSPEMVRLEELFEGFDLKIKPEVICQIIWISDKPNQSNEYTLKLSDHRSWIWAQLSSSNSIHIK